MNPRKKDINHLEYSTLPRARGYSPITAVLSSITPSVDEKSRGSARTRDMRSDAYCVMLCYTVLYCVILCLGWL